MKASALIFHATSSQNLIVIDYEEPMIEVEEPTHMRSYARIYREDYIDQDMDWFETDGAKVMEASEKIFIHDMIEAEGLKPGELYYVSGILMDIEASEEAGEPIPLIIDDHMIHADTYFRAQEKEQIIVVSFAFDASELQNQSINIFERLYHVKSNNENNQLQYVLVDVDEDMGNERQTVMILGVEEPEPEIPKPEEPKPEEPKQDLEEETEDKEEELIEEEVKEKEKIKEKEEVIKEEVIEENKEEPMQRKVARTHNNPQTGDEIKTIVLYGCILLLAVGLTFYLFKRR